MFSGFSGVGAPLSACSPAPFMVVVGWLMVVFSSNTNAVVCGMTLVSLFSKVYYYRHKRPSALSSATNATSLCLSNSPTAKKGNKLLALPSLLCVITTTQNRCRCGTCVLFLERTKRAQTASSQKKGLLLEMRTRRTALGQSLGQSHKWSLTVLT